MVSASGASCWGVHVRPFTGSWHWTCGRFDGNAAMPRIDLPALRRTQSRAQILPNKSTERAAARTKFTYLSLEGFPLFLSSAEERSQQASKTTHWQRRECEKCEKRTFLVHLELFFPRFQALVKLGRSSFLEAAPGRKISLSMFDSAQIPSLEKMLSRYELSVLVLYLKQQQLSKGQDFPQILGQVAEKLGHVLAGPNSCLIQM